MTGDQVQQLMVLLTHVGQVVSFSFGVIIGHLVVGRFA